MLLNVGDKISHCSRFEHISVFWRLPLTPLNTLLIVWAQSGFLQFKSKSNNTFSSFCCTIPSDTAAKNGLVIYKREKKKDAETFKRVTKSQSVEYMLDSVWHTPSCSIAKMCILTMYLYISRNLKDVNHIHVKYPTDKLIPEIFHTTGVWNKLAVASLWEIYANTWLIWAWIDSLLQVKLFLTYCILLTIFPQKRNIK